MTILSNGIAVLDDDKELSKSVRESNSLNTGTDGPLNHNLRLLKSGDYVVDGGAALGDHTSAYLKAVGDSGKVFAFEPHPRYVECLRHNCPSAEIYAKGLSNITGKGYMHCPVDGNVGSGFTTHKKEPDSTVEIEFVRLDDLKLNKLDLLKLDIEGNELRALLGATETICRCSPIIQIEWNPPAMMRVGIDPASVLYWFSVSDYKISTFMGTLEQGGEVIGYPTVKCK